MRHLKLFEEFEKNDVYSLVGKTVFASIGDGEDVKVTDDIIDSIGEWLGEEGIPCTKENFEICMANLEIDDTEASNIRQGHSFEPSFNDSKEDMLSDMRGDDDDYEDDDDD
jgi:hypothetical protein